MKKRETLCIFTLVLLVLTLGIPVAAEAPPNVPAGETVLTFVNRLSINLQTNPPQALVFGYFPTVQGLPGLLFSGAPSESTAFFTWTLNSSGAHQIQNADTTVVVLPTGQSLDVYFHSNPNQSWSDPASFSAGELVASFKAGSGTQTNSGPVVLVTQSYYLTFSKDFSFKGETFNFAGLLPHGFTLFAHGSNIPLTPPPVLTFSAGGSGIAIGGRLSALPH